MIASHVVNQILKGILFNHLGRLIEDLGGDCDAELLGCFQIDDHPEFYRSGP